jgi:hypothetical protein
MSRLVTIAGASVGCELASGAGRPIQARPARLSTARRAARIEVQDSGRRAGRLTLSLLRHAERYASTEADLIGVVADQLLKRRDVAIRIGRTASASGRLVEDAIRWVCSCWSTADLRAENLFDA